jgi:hypothetical protein
LLYISLLILIPSFNLLIYSILHLLAPLIWTTGLCLRIYHSTQRICCMNSTSILIFYSITWWWPVIRAETCRECEEIHNKIYLVKLLWKRVLFTVWQSNMHYGFSINILSRSLNLLYPDAITPCDSVVLFMQNSLLNLQSQHYGITW